MTGRFVPAITMITSSVTPAHRGGFMSINSSVAQFSSAVAAASAGLIIHDGPHHQLVGFGLVGWFYLVWAVVGLWLGGRVRAAQGVGRQQEVPVGEAA
jgi:MFS family permease